MAFGTGREPRVVAIGDVNGDQRLDLATANFYSNSVSLLTNLTDPPTDAIEDVNRLGTSLLWMWQSGDGQVQIRAVFDRLDVAAQFEIFDVAGRRIRRLDPGVARAREYSCTWDRLDSHGRRMPRGVYFVRFTAGELAIARKLVLLRD